MEQTVVAFGNFDLVGARAWVIRTGLAEHGYHVALCRTEVKGFFAKYKDLRRHWKEHEASAAAIYVVFLGHYFMPLAWFLARRKKIPVVFDAFLSLYDTDVCDRGRFSRFSLKAAFLWFIDWLACALADVVLLDTEEHKQYFVDRYGVRPEKILVLPVGCRSDLFTPDTLPPASAPFRVEFHGTYIPLQGIDVILAAVRELERRNESITFSLTGRGQTFAAMTALAKEWNLQSVEFLPLVSMEELPNVIKRGDVCLGIFGTSDKAKRVIPNKAYEVLACGRPLITARTPATERVLKDGESAMLISSDPLALADAITRMRNDEQLRRRIAEGGLALSREKFQPKPITAALAMWLSSRVATSR